MTALIASHKEKKDLRSLGARISSSQSDEIKLMQRWLAARGEALSMPNMGRMTMTTNTMGGATSASSAAHGTPGHESLGMEMSHDTSGRPMALMPGMLTPEQMDALRKAEGDQFDHLFLTGMI